jgi:hypothetical protein
MPSCLLIAPGTCAHAIPFQLELRIQLHGHPPIPRPSTPTSGWKCIMCRCAFKKQRKRSMGGMAACWISYANLQIFALTRTWLRSPHYANAHLAIQQRGSWTSGFLTLRSSQKLPSFKFTLNTFLNAKNKSKKNMCANIFTSYLCAKSFNQRRTTGVA